MITELQRLLIEKLETPESLELKYAIKHKKHNKYNNLVLFKYNQTESPMHKQVVQEARGIILDSNDNWKVVSRSFDKFFNYNEPLAKIIDLTNCKVQEKLDGSIMSLFFYDNQWHVASSGTPDASGPVNDTGMTFADLFWKIWKDNHYELPHPSEGKLTFIFEMTTPYNRVVVRHQESSLTLIGIRNNVTGNELDLDYFYGFDYPIVKHFPFKTFGEVIDSLKDFDGLNQEGYVLVDKDFNRIKIKHPKYIQLHHMHGNNGPSFKGMLGIFLAGEKSEYLSCFPEFMPVYDKVVNSFNNTVTDLQVQYDDILEALPPNATQKEFALIAKDMRDSGAMFAMRAGKIKSFEEYLRALSVDKCLESIGLKNE
jgi:hypothetical protein